MHLGGKTAIFIAWLANFKLLLFAFGKGPLASDPFFSLSRFIGLACLPINIQKRPSLQMIEGVILRPSVYEPPATLPLVVHRKWAPIPAILWTFLVSGLMHELVFYYLGRQKPTWGFTCFFLLHGSCLAVEVALKKTFGGRWQLPWLISGPLTIGFVMVTDFWLFLPSIHRCKAFERSAMEYDALVMFLENASQYIRISATPTSVYLITM
ncbi:hypothetical protein RCOM_0070050 [Ricinus communis]|uniref:Wax synthase domain-containing protein n=1 Tax=Ricinus communis TaxID=3988 RepID=B9SXH3_RICCO|nr:hypothetical protein RCOM_0070050 [Ricinus communis]